VTRKIVVLLLILSTLYPNESDLNLLNPYKKEIQKQSEDEIELIYDGEKYDWVNPLTLTASTAKSTEGELNQKLGVSLSQDIYRFGGISYQISYANTNRRYKLTDLQRENSTYYKSIYNTLLEIRKLKLQIKQAQFTLKNKELDILVQKEKYKTGSGDITLLNSALMDKNTQMQTILTLKNSLVTAKKELSLVTFVDEKDIELPRFRLITKVKFMRDNYEVKLSHLARELQKDELDITKANYYPRVSLNAEVGYQKVENYGATQFDSSYTSVGVSVSMPIDFNRRSTVEAKKVAYYKKVLNEEDKKIEQEAIYKEVTSNIQNFQKYRELTRENIKLYKDILESTQKGYSVGYKSGYDYKIIQNTDRIYKLEMAIYDIKIQQELLKLHYAIKR